jgi:hypothetical protein
MLTGRCLTGVDVLYFVSVSEAQYPLDLPPYNTTSRYVRVITDRLEVR